MIITMSMQKYKLVFFTPRPSTQSVLQHLFARFPNNVGRIGAYGGCAFVSPGTGALCRRLAHLCSPNSPFTRAYLLVIDTKAT